LQKRAKEEIEKFYLPEMHYQTLKTVYEHLIK
jgi:hypothetical protein